RILDRALRLQPRGGHARRRRVLAGGKADLGAAVNVLFDHQIFSYQTFGGASRYYAELMTELYRAGEPAFQLGVATSPNEYLRSAPFYRGSIIKRPGVAGFARTYVRNELATRAAALRRHHDIVHATFYDPAARLARRGAKLVVTVLDMIPER